MEKQFDGAHLCVRVEPALDGVIFEEIQQAEDAHALVVGHPFAHDFGLIAGEVDGFVEAVGTGPLAVGDAAQVADGGGGLDVKREECGVG